MESFRSGEPHENHRKTSTSPHLKMFYKSNHINAVDSVKSHSWTDWKSAWILVMNRGSLWNACPSTSSICSCWVCPFTFDRCITNHWRSPPRRWSGTTTCGLVSKYPPSSAVWPTYSSSRVSRSETKASTPSSMLWSVDLIRTRSQSDHSEFIQVIHFGGCRSTIQLRWFSWRRTSWHWR